MKERKEKYRSEIRQYWIDCHCHILPGLDDGSRSLEETARLLQQEYIEGVRTLIATPHFHPYRWEQSKIQVTQALLAARRLAMQIDPHFQIYLWNEAYWEDELIYHLNKGICHTAGDAYVLIESRPDSSEEIFFRITELLTANDYIPVFAHVERYQVLRRKTNVIDELKGAGAWIQVNAGSITGENGFATAVFCRRLLKKEKIDLIGTDCHRMDFRPPKFRECAEYIRRNTSQDYFDLLMKEHPQELLKKEDCYVAEQQTTMV